MSLQFAIIGCGRIGQRHAGHIQTVGKLAAVCDIEPAKAEELGKKNTMRIFIPILRTCYKQKKISM